MTEKHDKRIAVFGMFNDIDSLSRAVDGLKVAGFPSSDISALMPDRESTRTFAHEKHTKAPEGAATGAATGVVAGGAVGLLLGIGAITIPGLGLFLAAGPLMAALAGAGVGGAVGTLTGALIGMGIPEYEAKVYEAFLQAGGALVSVHCPDDDSARRAKSIMDGFGAVDVDKTKEARGKDRAHPTRH
jgi:hypothetical protein